MLLTKLVIGRACVALGAPLTSGTRPVLYDKLNIPIRCEHKWDRLHNIQVNVPFAENHKQTEIISTRNMTMFISGFVSPLCVVQILLYDVKLEQYVY